jgi:hypothetical protein
VLITLSKDTIGTPVQLTSMDLYNGNTQINGCAATKVESGNFNLILRCGDETMRLLMEGKGNLINFIKPATPDPVQGGVVTFEYATKAETNLTLTIYDALGKEVSRPVDNVHHDAGAWQVSTNVANLANGSYTYRLSTGNVVKSGQFVIQR